MLRGIEARCTVCGGKRIPFSAVPINLAGKPSSVGGWAAKFVGCAVATVGFAIALGAGLLAQTIFSGYAGLAVGLPVAIITLAAALTFYMGGRWLKQRGVRKQREARESTLTGLIAHKRGNITAAQAAAAMRLSEEEADALLTDMARDPDRNISLDLDETGVIHYLFGDGSSADRWRILEERARIAPDDGTHEQSEHEAAAAEEADAWQNRNKRYPSA